MPLYAASRTLAAPVVNVWDVLADPANWPEWWPGLERAEPTVRRALAPGALWRIEGKAARPSMRRNPGTGGTLLIVDVVPEERVEFQLPGDRVEVELRLEPVPGDDETVVTLVVEAPRFGGVGRQFPSQALGRLSALVHRACYPEIP